MKRLLLGSSMFILGMTAPACGDDMMAMDGELADMSRHQVALEADATMHHREILLATDALGMRRLEESFAQRASEHLGAMEHRARDMESMCHMGGRGFQAGAMHETLGRIRTRLHLHQERMAGGQAPADMHAEEASVRDAMTTMMGEMRHHQDEVRGAAARYSCRMHGH